MLNRSFLRFVEMLIVLVLVEYVSTNSIAFALQDIFHSKTVGIVIALAFCSMDGMEIGIISTPKINRRYIWLWIGLLAISTAFAWWGMYLAASQAYIQSEWHGIVVMVLPLLVAVIMFFGRFGLILACAAELWGQKAIENVFLRQ
ncbi:hypothetical protein A2326_00925 [candidate division WWE3 bacterium RIFOXYB2_FULL_41_6]|nr:MAG: hypothetical protein A2326_00925 [candidate division WWE3 bacterium RIFOXYB2_FULL_41_6]